MYEMSKTIVNPTAYNGGELPMRSPCQRSGNVGDVVSGVARYKAESAADPVVIEHGNHRHNKTKSVCEPRQARKGSRGVRRKDVSEMDGYPCDTPPGDASSVESEYKRKNIRSTSRTPCGRRREASPDSDERPNDLPLRKMCEYLRTESDVCLFEWFLYGTSVSERT